MDAFVKLVVVLVRFIGDSTNQVTKVNLLNKVLVTVTQVLLQDQVLLSFVVLLCVAAAVTFCRRTKVWTSTSYLTIASL